MLCFMFIYSKGWYIPSEKLELIFFKAWQCPSPDFLLTVSDILCQSHCCLLAYDVLHTDKSDCRHLVALPHPSAFQCDELLNHCMCRPPCLCILHINDLLVLLCLVTSLSNCKMIFVFFPQLSQKFFCICRTYNLCCVFVHIHYNSETYIDSFLLVSS